MYQINDDMPLGCIYESEDGDTKYCPMCNHDDVPYCQWFEDEPEAAIGIDERPVYCPILPSAQPEPCEDAVSRKMAMDAITASTPYCVVPDDYHISVVDMEFRISTLPSVTPKQKRGKWEERETFYAGTKNPIEEWQSARCSICGKYHTTPYMYFFNDYNFCPNCGARMI